MSPGVRRRRSGPRPRSRRSRPTSSSTRRPGSIPTRARGAGRGRLSWTLPKRSTSSTVARILSPPTRGSGGRAARAPPGRAAGPSSPSSTPARQMCAVRREESRPWKVCETVRACSAGSVEARGRRDPARPIGGVRAGARYPATNKRARRCPRIAIALPLTPDTRVDDGDVHAGGHVGESVREHERALKHVLRRDPVCDVDHLDIPARCV